MAPTPSVRSMLQALILSLCIASSLSQAPIAIGMTGPSDQDVGNRTAAGLAFAFEEANRAGGVMSRNLSLIFLNDDYNTTKSMANIHRLLDTEGVLLLAGVVGSDVASTAKPLVLQRGVPFVGAVTGTADLHTPFHRELVNIRASYADEMVSHAVFLVQHARMQRIACLYQNDNYGLQGYDALVAALANVGMQLVASATYTHGLTDVEPAVETIAGSTAKAQAIVLVALQDAAAKFISLFHGDSRADPYCIFTVQSLGWGSSFSTKLNTSVWSQVYFFFAVPPFNDSSWEIASNFAKGFTAAGGIPDPIALEGYITGRLIVNVLQRAHNANPTYATFLNEVYNDQLFVLDDLVVGMYSTNYTGCSQALCACNSGMRSTFLAQLDPATRSLGPSLGSLRWSVLECGNPVSNVIAPLLFGQLLPSWDDGWRAVAVAMGQGINQAFTEANKGGGAGGRDFILLQLNYSSSATDAMNTLSHRYPLVALLGGVVPSMTQVNAPVASVGNFNIEPDAVEPEFLRDAVRLQPATSLELMALAQWATSQCFAVHLRTPASDSGRQLLRTMSKSVESFQQRATSASTYTAASDVLSSTRTGCVIAVGSDDDVLLWYTALPSYPNLHLLTLSSPVMRLMAVSPTASSLSQASQLHFSTIITDKWNATMSSNDPGEPWKYGYILGQAVVQAIQHSQYASKSYTTPEELLSAWYTVKVMTSGALILGPYYGDNCSSGQSECECNLGARSVAVRSVASSVVQSQYSTSTCHVGYTALVESSGSSGTIPAIIGAVAGFFGLLAIGAGLYLHLAKRNHSAAPKDAHKPFCILFTDIQASTQLWATIPDVMAPALSTHHMLIRKLIAKHKCYEVKTIGDSFMCAAHTPQQALHLALAIQTALHDHDWGTDAIDSTYYYNLGADKGGQLSHCWNGLRVRVGIHYGLGDIQFDPVTKGYDYYGTVVNTAARIESVCHGGQIGVSQTVYDAVQDSLSDVVWCDLGCQPLRGLTEGTHLFQALPAGPLACRKFPPLRLDRQQDKDDSVEMEIVGAMPPEVSMAAGSVKTNSIVPTSSAMSMENWRWVETHPLVMQGSVSAEELKRDYIIVSSTLSTLLTTQSEKFRQEMVHHLCERLHVTNFGVQGSMLLRTLRGLTQRVLPATVVNAQQQLRSCLTRQNSKLSPPASPALTPASPALTLQATSFRPSPRAI